MSNDYIRKSRKPFSKIRQQNLPKSRIPAEKKLWNIVDSNYIIVTKIFFSKIKQQNLSKSRIPAEKIVEHR